MMFSLCACSDEPVEISLSRRRLGLVQRPGHEHFAIIRAKLKWSGGVTG